MTTNDVLHAMELAELAYLEDQPMLSDSVMTVIDDDQTGVQCYIRKTEDLLDITFRGSNSAKDWRHNLMFWKKCIPYGNTCSKIRVHTGFLNAYKSKQVRNRLLNMVTPEIRRIHICGHSYGAALSVLCAVDLQYNFPDRDIEVIVFGCPRIGNRAFQKSYNSRVFKTLRVENGNDIVTKVPFALWGYRHVGAKLHVGAPRLPCLVSFEQHRQQRYYSSLFLRLLPPGVSPEAW